ncbi:hypothetical protein PSACC_01667 [Paramicrosporidium saccamoebae]|uniref:Uncharacterized protein n=1 Tax=Paramicrosporidium saccamoebae TaxID=1246581 RepID=A0A2H9TLB4_9FUNG|nr:hypothetical protein PSACC_01667 [Paramicrosporidium saccamoebae]
MSEVNLDEYRDVDLLFRKNHVGSIERMVRKLEQNYVKILEASSAVDMMREAASGIDELLATLDITVEAAEETPIEACNVESDGSYEEYRQMWIEMQDSCYLKATEIIQKLSKDEKLAEEISRARRILLKLCERCMRDSKSDVKSLVEAVKAIALLDSTQPATVFYSAISLNPECDNLVLANGIQRIHDCCLALDVPADSFLDSVLSKLSLEGEKALGVAINLYSKNDHSLIKSIASRLFNQWVQLLPMEATLLDLFVISKILTSASESALPSEWISVIKEKLPIPVPSECGLLVAPLFGCPSDTPQTDADAMEKLFFNMFWSWFWLFFSTAVGWTLLHDKLIQITELSTLRLVCLDCIDAPATIHQGNEYIGTSSLIATNETRTSPDAVWLADSGGTFTTEVGVGQLHVASDSKQLWYRLDGVVSVHEACTVDRYVVPLILRRFVEAVDACRQRGMELANVHYGDQEVIKYQLWKCLPKNTQLWIASFDLIKVDKRPCQWLSTFPGVNSAISDCELLAYPLCYDHSLQL